MVLAKVLATKFQPLWRVEVPLEVNVTGSPSGKTANVTETLTVNRFANQIAAVVRGTGVGEFLHVQSNTASVLTFEEDSTILDSTSVLALSTFGQPQGSTPENKGNIVDYFGAMMNERLPMLVRDFMEGRYHGSSNQPAPEEYISMKNTYETSFPIILKNAMILALGFGSVEEATSDYNAGDPALQVSSALYPGAYDMYVTPVTTGFTAGDIVHITAGTGGVQETGKVASVGSQIITLVHPLKNYHGADAVVHEVKCTTPGVPDTVITHTLTIGHELPSFNFEGGIRREVRFSGADIVMQFFGLMVNKLAFKSSPGNEPLRVDVGVQGTGFRYKNTSLVLLDDVGTKAEVGYDKGVYMPSKSTLTFNAVVYNESMEFSFSLDRGNEALWAHHSGVRPHYRSGDPIAIYEGGATVSLNVSIPLTNRNVIALVAEDTEFTASKVFERAGTNDKMTISFTGCHVKDPGIDIPEDGMIPQNVDCVAEKVSIAVADFIPYYIV